MKTTLVLAALVLASACVASPTDPVELAAWKAEKTARTEARRPAPGSILPAAASLAVDEDETAQDFKALKQQREVLAASEPQ